MSPQDEAPWSHMAITIPMALAYQASLRRVALDMLRAVVNKGTPQERTEAEQLMAEALSSEADGTGWPALGRNWTPREERPPQPDRPAPVDVPTKAFLCPRAERPWYQKNHFPCPECRSCHRCHVMWKAAPTNGRTCPAGVPWSA